MNSIRLCLGIVQAASGERSERKAPMITDFAEVLWLSSWRCRASDSRG